MSYSDCIRIFKEAAGRDVPESEIDDFLSAMDAHKRYLLSKDSSLNDMDAALRAANEVANNLKMAAIIEKRNAALNYVKRLERVGWIGNTFGNNIALGIESMLVGTQRAKAGSRVSVASVQDSLKKSYLAGFTSDIERTGHGALLASGAMDRDVARALWLQGRADMAPMLARLPDEAISLGKVIAKWQEVSRVDANRAGAWIGKRDDYITRQSHDSEKIRTAGFDEWRKMAYQTFDIGQMLAQHGVADPEKMLRAEWINLSSGNHLKAAPEDVASGFKGPGNLAKKLSQGRSILFKDADAWFDYNERFGTGNLRESVLSSLTHSADATGLMQMLGTNPEAMLKAITDDLTIQAKDAGKVDMVAKLGEAQGKINRYLSAVDGSMNIAGNAMWARRAANVRSWESLAKLGGMLLSQLNDVAVYGSGASYQGRGFLSGMHEAVSGLGRSLKAPERRELAASLGVVLDNMAGELGRMGSFSEAGTMSGLMQTFMKWNGSQWWTSRMRTSAAFGMSHHMALQAGKDFTSLSPEYQRVLGLYNITAADWDVVRATATKHVDGKAYIVPEGLRDVSIDALYAHSGPAAGDAAISKARRDIEDKLRNYFIDQTSTLALEPDVKTRAILTQGTQAGTWTGEFARFMTQFKSFTGAYMQRVVGRELYGRGYDGDSLLGALRAGNGEFAGLAQLVVTSTLMGYGSMVLKDLAKGKTPRNPAEDPTKTLLAAMVQGGGAGIYGDFLFGAASRMGGGTIESLAGPVPSTFGRVVDLYHKGIAGDDVASAAVNEALNNTPFLNLFYTRAALNYMVLYRMQEQMNPGYLRRMERNMQKETGQEFLIRPSEVVR